MLCHGELLTGNARDVERRPEYLRWLVFVVLAVSWTATRRATQPRIQEEWPVDLAMDGWGTIVASGSTLAAEGLT